LWIILHPIAGPVLRPIIVAVGNGVEFIANRLNATALTATQLSSATDELGDAHNGIKAVIAVINDGKLDVDIVNVKFVLAPQRRRADKPDGGVAGYVA
jgi:hypothetical protein